MRRKNDLVHRFFIRMKEGLKSEESFEIGQFQASFREVFGALLLENFAEIQTAVFQLIVLLFA